MRQFLHILSFPHGSEPSSVCRGALRESVRGKIDEMGVRAQVAAAPPRSTSGRRICQLLLVLWLASTADLLGQHPGESFEDGPIADSVVFDHPYSADGFTTVDLRFGNGRAIRQRTTSRFYRDNAGRVRVEHRMEGLPMARTAAERRVRLGVIPNPCDRGVLLTDPMTESSRLLSRALFAETAWGGNGLLIPLGGIRFLRLRRALDIQSDGGLPGSIFEQEALGTRTIAGLEAVGRRSTLTVAAWQVGNKEQFTLIDEEWFSPDLKIIVEAKHDDSRFGSVEYRLHRVERVEPPGSLFTVAVGASRSAGGGEESILAVIPLATFNSVSSIRRAE